VGNSIWVELVTLGALIWIGYIGARLAGRFNLPSVTGFLIMGVAAGPYGLGLLSLDLMHKIDFVNPIALGLIVFLIGEELTGKMLRRHHWSFWLISILGTALPTALVYWGVSTVRPDQPEIAWLLAVIAMGGAPATIMSVLAETKAKGKSCNMLLGSAAFADIATVITFSSLAPFLAWKAGQHATVAAAWMDSVKVIGGAAVLGLAAGLVLGWLLGRAFEPGELLSLGLTHVLLVVAIANLIGVSTLLAPLVMGITVAVMEEQRGQRGRCFDALRAVEYPIYIIFFTLAGAELDLSVVLEGGIIMLIYIIARAVGKVSAGFFGGLLGRMGPRNAIWFGLGSLPQAGVAVGLALAVSQTFPEIGQTVTAVVLASIVFFEAVGPVAAKRALVNLGCETEPPTCELEETPVAKRERTILVPVSHHWSADKLLHVLKTTDTETDYPARFVLSRVVTSARNVTVAEAMARGTEDLSALAEIARKAGYTVDTLIRQSRTTEAGIARLARDSGAELVVLGSPPPSSAKFVNSFVRSPLHRIIDQLETPIYVIPEDWRGPLLELESEEAGGEGNGGEGHKEAGGEPSGLDALIPGNDVEQS